MLIDYSGVYNPAAYLTFDSFQYNARFVWPLRVPVLVDTGIVSCVDVEARKLYDTTGGNTMLDWSSLATFSNSINAVVAPAEGGTTNTLQEVVDAGGTVTSGVVTIDAANARTNTYGGLLTVLGENVQGGVSTVASGADGATALGYFSIAGGNYGATAIGDGTTASGNYGATAMGNHAHATNDSAFAWSGQVTDYFDNGPGTFNIDPVNGVDGVFVGTTSLATLLAAAGGTATNATLLTHGGTNVTEAALDTDDFGWDGTNITVLVEGGAYTNLFAGSGTTGSVTSAGGDAGKYLKADGTWDTPADTDTTDHAALSNLGITASGHTGTASRIWGADGSGAADEIEVGTGLDLTAGVLTATGGGETWTDEVWANSGSVTQACANASYTTMVFGTEERDAQGCFDGTNFVFSGTNTIEIMGAIGIQALATTKTITIALEKNGDRVRFAYQDNASGIASPIAGFNFREDNDSATNVWNIVVYNTDTASRNTYPINGAGVWIRARRKQ